MENSDAGSPQVIVGALNPALDRLIEVDRLLPGEIHMPASALEVAGGKGLNVARAALALGADVLAVPLLGGHCGQRVADLLAADHVPFEAVRGEQETRSTLAVLDRDRGALTQFYERGQPEAFDVYERYRDCVLSHCRPGRWLSISGSLPPGIDPSVERELVCRAGGAGARVAVDQHGPYLEAAMSGGPALVKINEHEAHDVTRAEPREAASLLSDRAGGARVIVTVGTEGALLYDREQTWRGTLDVRGTYSTGCGDAFLAGMVSSLEAAPDAWLEAFAAALAAGAANAELPGPGVLDPLRARELAARVRIERL